MRHRIPGILLTLAVLSGLTLAGPLPSLWSANLSTDYTGVPPYISDVVTPNVLMLMDNSLSMRERANCDPVDCLPQPDGGSIDTGTGRFLYTRSYSGYFDSTRCYTYHSGTWNNDTTDVNNRFANVAAKTPAGVAGICADDQWDGNLLNWITFRRIDALKNAMIGGECAVSRNPADGTCPPIGAPAKTTIQSHRSDGLTPYGLVLDRTDANQIVGRVPAAYRYTDQPGFLYIYLRGQETFGSYVGWFCMASYDLTLYASEPCDTGWHGDLGATVTLHFHQDAVAGYTIPGYTIHHPLVHHDAYHADAYEYWYIASYIEGVAQWAHYTVPAVDYPAYDDPAWDEIVADQIVAAVPYEDYDYSYTYPTTWTRVAGLNPNAAGFNIRLASDTQRTGVLQQIGNKARFGLMIFHPDTTQDGGKVLVGIGARQTLDFNTGNIQLPVPATNNIAMINGIELIKPATPTPLAEALYSAARYIAQLPPTFDAGVYTYPLAFSPAVGLAGTGVGSIGPGEITALISPEPCPAGYIGAPGPYDHCAAGRDPYFFGQNNTPAWASPSAVVPCCKTFVIIVTDGAPTLDANIPAGLQEYASTRLPSITQCTGAACASADNTPPSTLLAQHRTDYPGGSHYLDDVALWAHTVDLRQSVIPGIGEPGHDLPGMQNITLYTVYAFGSISGREILMQAARQGGFTDAAPYNGVPDLTGQVCTNADSTTGVSSPEWDKINNITGLLGPDCIPDNYFESSNADSIRDRLFLTISQILETTTSGAGVSVLASSSTGEGTTVQTFFYSKLSQGLNQLSWLGHMQNFFVDKFGNLREDTNGDGQLVLKDDYVIKLRYDSSAVPPSTVADRYRDTMGTGEGNLFVDTVSLSALKPVWEAGRRLALLDPDVTCPANAGGVNCRRILTWVDVNNDGIVDPTERVEFSTATDIATLCTYLGGVNVSTCASAGPGQDEATSIINFIRGTQIDGLRDRKRSVMNDSNVSVTKVWKLGDIMGSTPVTVAAPKERYDVLYGDTGYARYYQRYKDRRQVVYSGANDGMLHAFNGGYLSYGDVASTPATIEQLRFTKEPKQPGSITACTALPCAGTVPTYAFRSDQPMLGAELWAFIPQDLLPQLRWLTDPSYTHTYYVDLKPKVTDARIFPDDADHPGGWGTVLIGGSRFGGSCSGCIYGKGGARTVTADFGGGPSTRVFLSSYFVLDITNPEKDPVLLWTFRDQDLGLTTAAPAIVRVNTEPGNSPTGEKWYVVFGTGPTHYDGSSGQTGKIFLVDLQLGPTYSAVNATSGTVRGKTCSDTSPCMAATTGGISQVHLYSTGQGGAFMGDASSLDVDLDFRVDVVYLGSVICRGGTPSPCNGSNPVWRGTVWRLTTNHGSTNLNTWGMGGAPKKLISDFTCLDSVATCPTVVGPVVAAPSLSIDDKNNFWVFFGSGRLITTLDKTNEDTQYFFGVKDCFISNLCDNETDNNHNLRDVSNIVICTDPDTAKCDPMHTVSTDGGGTFTQRFNDPNSTTALVQDVQGRDGWFTTLPTLRERSLTKATILGGTVVFSTFSPSDSACAFSGDARLYALFYLTGTGYTASALGDSTVAGTLVANRSVSLGSGMSSEVALHVGGRGTGLAGSPGLGPPVTAGCQSGLTAITGLSTGGVTDTCVQPAFRIWSALIAWRDL